MIRIKRVCEAAELDDGTRILVDRLWPRGVEKDRLRVDFWHRDIVPSSQPRKWFGHDPARWDEFRRRYFAELDGNLASWTSLVQLARSGNVTLLYSAKDEEQNNARALRDYVESRL